MVSNIFGARFVSLLFLDVKENEKAMCAIKNKQKARSQELLTDTLVLLQTLCGLCKLPSFAGSVLLVCHKGHAEI